MTTPAGHYLSIERPKLMFPNFPFFLGIPASEVFERSLQEFDQIGNHMLDTFMGNLSEFKQNNSMDMD